MREPATQGAQPQGGSQTTGSNHPPAVNISTAQFPWMQIAGIVVPIIFAVIVAAVTLHGSIQYVQGKLDAVEKRFDDFDKGLDRFKGHLGDFSTQLSDLRNANGDLKGAIGELRGSVGEFRTTLDRVRTDLKAIDDWRVATSRLQTEHENLAKALEDLKTQLGSSGDLAKRLDRLESRLNPVPRLQ